MVTNKENEMENVSKSARCITGVLAFLSILGLVFFLSHGLPSQLSTDSASTILTTMISVESILLGFITVAFYFLAGKYPDYFISAGHVRNELSEVFNQEKTPTELKKLSRILITSFDGKDSHAKILFYIFLMNFVLMCVNIFYMLIILIRMDSTVVMVSTLGTLHIYFSITMLALNTSLVFVSLNLILKFIVDLAKIQSLEKTLRYR